jgi:DNA polymerase-3 subunit gamma/tau
MSYQVLARKWRPRLFREMVGQEHVLKALINALDHDRLHHAYLFTGTRGVGKTTIARILAKCLNCDIGVSSEPCNQCSSCTEINEGRFVDLIEVDAASRTKVEDTRELLDNVQYAPTRGRYKVYLIDEVHMLSNSSFNALLKTLEEPPPHVKFLLATTDPQKLPVTVLSRCLQFSLKNMSAERIVGHLKFVLEKEMVPFEEASLWHLGRSADGSMRDALSLTDQAISFGNGKVTEADVRTMLGSIDQTLVYDVLTGLIAEDGAAILAGVNKLAEHSPDYSEVLGELIAVLHRIAIAQVVPEAIDNSLGDRKQIYDFAQKIASEDIQLYYQTALLGRRDLPLSPDARSGLEMTLLRMLAFKPQGVADLPKKELPKQEQPTIKQVTDNATTALAIKPEVAIDSAQLDAQEAAVPVKKSKAVFEPKVSQEPITEHADSPLNQNVSAQNEPPFAEDVDSHVDQKRSAENKPPFAEDLEGHVDESLSAENKPPFADDVDGYVDESLSAESKPPFTEDLEGYVDESLSAENKPPFADDVDGYVDESLSAENKPPFADDVDGYVDESLSAENKPPFADDVDGYVDESLSAENQPPFAMDDGYPTASNLGVEHQQLIAELAETTLKTLAGDKALVETVIADAVQATPAVVKKYLNKSVEALSELNSTNWFTVYRQLDTGGLLQSTVANCIYIGMQENVEKTVLEFLLDVEQSTLYDASHQQRLADLLVDYFGQSLEVKINNGQPDRETPAQIIVRLQQERQAQAESAIKTDPVVMQLQESLGATIIEGSIEPIDG